MLSSLSLVFFFLSFLFPVIIIIFFPIFSPSFFVPSVFSNPVGSLSLHAPLISYSFQCHSFVFAAIHGSKGDSAPRVAFFHTGVPIATLKLIQQNTGRRWEWCSGIGSTESWTTSSPPESAFDSWWIPTSAARRTSRDFPG